MEKLLLYVLVLCYKILPCAACELSNITITLEKEECGACITVNATWCSGYCLTKDPSLKHPVISMFQHVCTYKEIIYETVKIPDCPANVDSSYTYPVAIDCHCGQCDMETSDCTVRGLGPSYCSHTQDKE
ncbi:follitropin subunit beta [Spea bombifrons]|uniref:follitropin subunit beta n=1 Tax=Spea bombifrons TaxID=233779 RepID=UPI002348F85E|nr:follitropin subunit beta [Spea bombifrons]